MIHYIGYIALILNLTSMSMRHMVYLRFLSLLANILYFLYGILLQAPPIIVGCGIAAMIHGFQLCMIYKKSNLNGG